ncbi:MAG: acyl-CoA dehydrogenase family protein [Betaproteobacteria bacterium]|nr:acyl-CoA dehydrogenase family protein [Betaproteobacteria bacterium]MCC6249764.1 acyl-CoA dehydrogenase family protein [Rubrivivax sp.]MCL4699521.1 acyl-CoA dehydrogenase family protein [Burkholderiaceae bacterium]
MDFQFSELSEVMQGCLGNFMKHHVLPANAEWHRAADSGAYPLALIERLKRQAREEALWNLFLPGLRDDEPGTRLSNLDYAPLAEMMGRVPWSAEVFNCSAPDTGNIELLHLFATPVQRERWLVPLLGGEIRSCFAMSEPDVASSDATNIRTSIRRDGDELVINGRKWFITGASHPNCRLAVVMGVSDESAQPHARHSIALVPMDTPGLEVVRNVPIMQHAFPEGHCELLFKDVRVPADHLLGEPGQGFTLAQARLGPGRVHHCMRTIGQCELALELMCERALSRRTFGRVLSEHANVQDWIAHSRVEIDQARLLVLRAAWRMDREGNAAARVDVSAIKLVAAQLQTRVVDRAMQIFGAMGLTPDTPLAWLWTWGRAMRFLDGPDEVHLRTVARHELARSREHLGETAVYYR